MAQVYTDAMPRASQPIKTELTLEQFLEFEAQSKERREWVNGQVFVMAEGYRRHNRIAVRLGTKAENASENTPCLVAIADTLVLANGTPYYPDVMIYSRDEDDPRLVKQPCVLVEVLSKSTEDIDWGEKWLNYQTLGSLEAYVLLEQDTIRAEIFRRVEDGWHYERIETGGSLKLPCIALEIPLDEIYAGIA